MTATELGQRLVEEALDEPNPLLAPEAGEVSAHLRGGDGEEVDSAQVQMAVLGEPGIGLGQAAEGVGNPHGSIVGAERVEGRAGENRRAAAPGTRLDQIALDAIADDRLDAR